MYNDLLRFVVMQDPNWDYRTLDVGRQLELARKADNGVLAATSTDLTRFVGRGGKLLIYHGWADQNIPPRGSVSYYNELVKTMGKEKVAGAVRLFMVPGMGHCGGGDGPNEFDMMAVLEQWREHGKRPAEILASQLQEGQCLAHASALSVSADRQVQGVRQYRSGGELRRAAPSVPCPVQGALRRC